MSETSSVLRAVGDLEMPLRKALALGAALDMLSEDLPRGGDDAEHVACLASMLHDQLGEVIGVWTAAFRAAGGQT